MSDNTNYIASLEAHIAFVQSMIDEIPLVIPSQDVPEDLDTPADPAQTRRFQLQRLQRFLEGQLSEAKKTGPFYLGYYG